MNRIYEELFIVKPDTAEEEADQFVEQLKTQLTTAGAVIERSPAITPMRKAKT